MKRRFSALFSLSLVFTAVLPTAAFADIPGSPIPIDSNTVNAGLNLINSIIQVGGGLLGQILKSDNNPSPTTNTSAVSTSSTTTTTPTTTQDTKWVDKSEFEQNKNGFVIYKDFGIFKIWAKIGSPNTFYKEVTVDTNNLPQNVQNEISKNPVINEQSLQLPAGTTPVNVSVSEFKKEEYDLVADFGAYRIWKHKTKPNYFYNEVVVDPKTLPKEVQPFVINPITNTLLNNKGVNVELKTPDNNGNTNNQNNALPTIPINQTDDNMEKVKAMVQEALSAVGTTGSFNGEALGSQMDCSRFVQFLYQKHLGIQIPRVTDQQFRGDNIAPDVIREEVSQANLQPGDLVFLDTGVGCDSCAPGYKNFTHVVMYVGDNMVVDASQGRNDIQKYPLSDAGKFLGAVRYYKK